MNDNELYKYQAMRDRQAEFEAKRSPYLTDEDFDRAIDEMDRFIFSVDLPEVYLDLVCAVERAVYAKHANKNGSIDHQELEYDDVSDFVHDMANVKSDYSLKSKNILSRWLHELKEAYEARIERWMEDYD